MERPHVQTPYQHRVNIREFLNLPGFHDGAYVMAYVEDTSQRSMQPSEYGDGTPKNFEGRRILELADCRERISLEFEGHSEIQRVNSIHKLDTLIEALQEFRDGLIDEFELYERRQAAVDAEKASRRKPAAS